MNIKLPKKDIINKLPINTKQKEIFIRRINKFKKEPVVFIQDSYKKRSAQVSKYISKKEVSVEIYSVIVAVWNAENYIDDFLKSLVDQNIDFKKHIQVILVDDGSADKSSHIIKNWQRRYPKNIHYYYKINGGQASARNLGLKHAKTEWITFIDPDDFVSSDFFYQIEKCISKEKNLNLVAANIIRYDDEYNSYSDSHPLKKRFSFKGPTKIIDIKNQDSDILTSVCGVFVKKSLLDSNKLQFNENLKVIFEDTHFINKYILFNSKGRMGFVKDAKYYHRNTVSHAIDPVWEEPSNFDMTISESLLDLCRISMERTNYVPISIQITVLYHVTWIVSKIIDNDLAVGFLEGHQKQRFLALLDEIFYYIDEDCILSYGYSKALFANKIGLLNVFKNKAIESGLQRAYIDSYNHNKKLFRVRYFSNSQDDLISFKFDKEDIIPSHMKILQHDLLDRVFNFEYIIWVKIPEKNNILNLFVNNSQSVLHLGAKRFKNLGKQNIFDFFEDSGEVVPLNKQTWFFIDSDLKADDNAEHLYRYVMNNTEMRKEQLLFGLNATSHDWSRLKAEGFNLVDMQDFEANIALRSSNKILSSNASDYIMYFDGKKSLLNKNFVFLQHGVIHNDLSQWLKAKDFDFFLTSTVDEYNSIAGNISNYFFTDREVKLTGQPRYDSLFVGNDTQKQILIMPTWRKDIVGKLVSGKTAEREFNPNFMQTDYAQRWQSFLNNEDLKQLSLEYGYKIVYFPHANVQIYSHLFDIPDYIDVVTHDIGSIQPLFQKSALMITDYSSVAFEMAFLNKQVIYYQFDEDEFLSGSHTSKPNYFIYREDGFGPVVNEENEVIHSLQKLLANEAEPIEPFASRIEKTFLYRDMYNSERVFSAICDIDKEIDVNIDVLKLFIEQAKRSSDWELLESRSQQLLNYAMEKEEITLNKFGYTNYLLALYHQYRYSEILLFITENEVECADYWKARVDLCTGYEERGLRYFSDNIPISVEEQLNILLLASRLENIKLVELLQRELSSHDLSETEETVFDISSKILRGKIDDAIEAIDNTLAEMKISDKKLYKLELVACDLCVRSKMLEKANGYILQYVQHSKRDLACRIRIIQLASQQDKSKNVITQYNIGFTVDSLLAPTNIEIIYIKALCDQERWSEAQNNIVSFHEKNNCKNSMKQLQQYYITTLYNKFMYSEILLFVTENEVECADYWKAKVDLCTGYEERGLRYFSDNIPISVEEQLNILLLASRLENIKLVELLQRELSSHDLSETEETVFDISSKILRGKIDDAIEAIDNTLAEMKISDKKLYKLELVACDLCVRSKMLEKAYSYLLKYEKHTLGDHACRLRIIEVSDLNGQFEKIIRQYERAYVNKYIQPFDKVHLIYICALFATKQWSKVTPLFEEYFRDKDLSLYIEILNYYLDMLIASKKWLEAEQLFKSYEKLREQRYYESLLTLLRLGYFEGLEEQYPKPTGRDSYPYWQLMLEVSELNNNLELVEYCLKGMIAVFPEKDHKDLWNKLSLLRKNTKIS